MNQNFLQKLPALVITSLCCLQLSAQKILVTTNNSELYAIELSNGSCSSRKIDVPCNLPGSANLFSIALYKDTLYYLSNTGTLFQSVLDKPASCKSIAVSPQLLGFSVNSLTIDKDGMLYWINMGSLVRYDPQTQKATALGNVPFAPAGDLVFYKDKLYLTSLQGLVEINITNPSQSQLAIPTPGSVFYGLINIPLGCNKSTVYGIDVDVQTGTSSLVEIDMENKKVLGKLCTFPMNIYDAGSITESGIVAGITVSSIDAKKQCGPAGTGSIAVNAFTATPNVSLTYALNNAQPVTDGKFTVTAGNHTISIKSSDGCSVDTTVTIGMADKISVNLLIKPDTCAAQKGNVSVQKISGGNSLLYAMDNNAGQTGTIFTNLSGGNHQLTVTDENFCRLDTAFMITSYQPPIPLTGLTIVPSSCSQATGQITVLYSADVTGIRLDGGNFQTVNSFTNVATGEHRLQLKTNTCLYDTLLVVPSLSTTTPVISFSNTSPDCYNTSTGSSTIVVSSVAAPFTVSFGGGNYVSSTQFNGLAAGIYPVNIKDANGCTWPAADTVLPYTLQKPLVQPVITHAECAPPQPGKIKLTISGPEAPYRFGVGPQRFASGSELTDLLPGNYTANIYTSKNCLVDSVRITILRQSSSGVNCDTIFVPSAFTPNGDGRNDVFKAIGNIPGSQSFIFRVYNRGGQVVFESRNIEKGWDGRIQGQPQPTGTYVWLVEHTNSLGEKKVYKGTAVLLR